MKNIAKLAAIIATASVLWVGCAKDEESSTMSSDLSGIKGDKIEEFHI